jgi:hypothetical protein
LIILEICVGVASIIGVGFPMVRWLGKLDRNTESMERLTTVLDNQATALADHGQRITVLETHDQMHHHQP